MGCVYILSLEEDRRSETYNYLDVVRTNSCFKYYVTPSN